MSPFYFLNKQYNFFCKSTKLNESLPQQYKKSIKLKTTIRVGYPVGYPLTNFKSQDWLERWWKMQRNIKIIFCWPLLGNKVYCTQFFCEFLEIFTEKIEKRNLVKLHCITAEMQMTSPPRFLCELCLINSNKFNVVN